MPRTDPYEAQLMRQCQSGVVSCGDPEHRPTGSVCRKPNACRDEGRCYFVAAMERHMEKHPEEVFMLDKPRFHVMRIPEPVVIHWDPGVDGFAWAI